MYRLVTRDGDTVRQDPSEQSAIRAAKCLAQERDEPLRLMGVYGSPTTDRTLIEPDGTRREATAREAATWGCLA